MYARVDAQLPKLERIFYANGKAIAIGSITSN